MMKTPLLEIRRSKTGQPVERKLTSCRLFCSLPNSLASDLLASDSLVFTSLLSNLLARLLLLSVALLLGCETFNRGYLERARPKIAAGVGQEELETIGNYVGSLSENDQAYAVDSVKLNDGEAGQRTLRKLLLSPDIKSTATRADIADTMADRDRAGTAPAFVQAYRKYPEISENMLKYFGEKQYKPAIPAIKESVNERRDLVPNIEALARMKDPDTNAYVLSLCMSEDIELRDSCFLGVARSDNEELKKQISPLVLAVFRQHPDEVMASLGASAAVALSNKDVGRASISDLLKVRAESTDPGKKKLAADTLKKLGSRDRSLPKNYEKRIAYRLKQKLGARVASQLIKKMNQALYDHATSSSDITQFIVRAYRRHFGIGEREALRRMKAGLSYPGSLHALVKYVILQYSNNSLRIYGLATILKISRPHAEIVLKLVRSGSV